MLSCVQLFVTPWTAARQSSLSITNSQSLLKLMSVESVMPSNHLILCCPLLLLPSIFPSIRVFSNELALASGGQSIGASASASVPPMNIQDIHFILYLCAYPLTVYCTYICSYNFLSFNPCTSLFKWFILSP